MAIVRPIIIGLTVVLAASTASAAKFYKWVDDEGNTHYSQRAPAGIDTEEVRTYGDNSRTSPPPAAPAPTTAAKPIEAKKKVPELKKDPETCRKAQDNYRIMSTRPLVLDPEGNIMSIEKKQEELEKAQRVIDIHCD